MSIKRSKKEFLLLSQKTFGITRLKRFIHNSLNLVRSVALENLFAAQCNYVRPREMSDRKPIYQSIKEVNQNCLFRKYGNTSSKITTKSTTIQPKVSSAVI